MFKQNEIKTADVISQLSDLNRLTGELSDVKARHRQLVAKLVVSGVSLRTVADAAGVSHMTVRKIYRETVS